ncbi:hypothetical protein P5V15_009167 [Pogonomyrmex californicus]
MYTPIMDFSATIIILDEYRRESRAAASTFDGSFMRERMSVYEFKENKKGRKRNGEGERRSMPFPKSPSRLLEQFSDRERGCFSCFRTEESKNERREDLSGSASPATLLIGLS